MSRKPWSAQRQSGRAIITLSALIFDRTTGISDQAGKLSDHADAHAIDRKLSDHSPLQFARSSSSPYSSPCCCPRPTRSWQKAHLATAPCDSGSNSIRANSSYVRRPLWWSTISAIRFMSARPTKPMPIASVTKLMTAMVILDAGLPTWTRRSRSPRPTATCSDLPGRVCASARSLTRGELLTLALMASENRAAAALGRTYPGGTDAFVDAMNRKAGELGMHQSRFADAAGLDAGNVATAQDLARMVLAAMQLSGYPRGHHPRSDRRQAAEETRPAALREYQSSAAQRQLGYPGQQDRLHQRVRSLPGDAHRVQRTPRP